MKWNFHTNTYVGGGLIIVIFKVKLFVFHINCKPKMKGFIEGRRKYVLFFEVWKEFVIPLINQGKGCYIIYLISCLINIYIFIRDI